MDNFQSGELLVGNLPRKTKPEKRIDPRLVGYRFVTSLPSTRKKWAIRGGKKTIPGAVYVPLVLLCQIRYHFDAPRVSVCFL